MKRLKNRREDDDYEATRSKLARTVLWFCGVFAAGSLVLLALERPLGLSPEAIHFLQAGLAGLFGLTTMSFVFYFRPRG